MGVNVAIIVRFRTSMARRPKSHDFGYTVKTSRCLWRTLTHFTSTVTDPSLLWIRRQFADQLFVFHGPHTDLAGEVASDDTLAVVSKDDSRRRVGETFEFD